MLTVDYDRLELSAGDLVLDMGAGAGRHSFECFRRGAQVVALDYGFEELTPVGALMAGMLAEGEAPAESLGACVNGNALCLPFPDDTFDRIICSEVLEHISTDTEAMAELHRVLRPGGMLAATVPSWLPEKICWALSAEYHAPLSPGGHVRIYTEAQLKARLGDAGFDIRGSHRVHALHSPYWWLRCVVGPTNENNPLVHAYHDLLVWDMVDQPVVTQLAEKALSPVLGKSIVIYAHKAEAPRKKATARKAPAKKSTSRKTASKKESSNA